MNFFDAKHLIIIIIGCIIAVWLQGKYSFDPVNTGTISGIIIIIIFKMMEKYKV